MTPDERLEQLVEACELAAAILRERADVEAGLARASGAGPWPPLLTESVAAAAG